MTPPAHPPRLAHLCTRAVAVRLLIPAYSQAHDVDAEESAIRLDAALRGRLLDDLLDATWTALRASTKRLTDAELLEKVATTLKENPHRKPRVPAASPAWSAFMVLADVEAGIAGDSARNLMETERGRQMGATGLAAAGKHVADELTRK